MRDFATLGVVGAGAWGTALANAAARADRRVLLFARDPAQAEAMRRLRENEARLPGLRLDAAVAATSDLALLAGVEALLVAVPAQAVRGVCEALAAIVAERCPVIICAKGIERGTQSFMTDIVAQTLPRALPAVLSGPSFAADVAAGLPTAVVIGAPEPDLAAGLAEALSSRSLRLYHTTDARGVEIGGAGKNVLAIAAGMVEGRGLGDSAKAALVARGFAELRRFAAAHGARPETLMGLSGLGDLMLSAATPKSRNFAFGLALGRGEPPNTATHGKLTEGAFTASVLCEMARRVGIDMPVSEAVAAILDAKLSIDAAIDDLMNRPVRSEE
ncbi:glycerol-3-phosphate dehydrogenase (NAD(P)+) [Rhizobiales bacterium GAS188]|nr:glycerol-3-phosphate dehydrogenase (NAD(P)+) [Rhizobiales bacterium GAS188]